MKPFLAVQILLTNDEDGKNILGSCFRLHSKNHYITASHCVGTRKPQEISVLNCLDMENDLRCESIHRHPKSDLAIIKISGTVPDTFEQFKLVERDTFVGTQIHCFGVIPDWSKERGDAPCRVIGGIIQRDFNYKDGDFESPSLELSSPIPKGMSGGPAFIANAPEEAIGVAIASIYSEVIMYQFKEYENEKLKEREKISEITRYGVILRLKPFEAWINEIMNENV